MIISRTPLRISFVGGGSDLPAFYESETGAVVSTSINKYIYITVNKKFDDKIRASYSVTEIINSVEEMKHELIREALKEVKINGGIEITSISDIPSKGTGLGSSSSYTVGLLNALYAYRNKHVGAERLAREACKIEIDRCGKPIGKQDQYIAAYGGFQYIQFEPDGNVFVDPVICNPEIRKKLKQRLLLLYTGLTRSADGILNEEVKNIMKSDMKKKILRKMGKIAQELRDELQKNGIDCVGEMLHQGWLEKRKMASGISNTAIDNWYETARQNVAIGGKLLVAGGGGFLIIYTPPERKTDVIRALPELRPIDFQFEPQGSKIIYVEENE